MRQNLERRRCDHCHREQDSSPKFGPPAFVGWLEVKHTVAPAGLAYNADYCSIDCAIVALFENRPNAGNAVQLGKTHTMMAKLLAEMKARNPEVTFPELNEQGPTA